MTGTKNQGARRTTSEKRKEHQAMATQTVKQTPWQDNLDRLDALVQEAEAAKATTSDSPERKVTRSFKSVLGDEATKAIIGTDLADALDAFIQAHKVADGGFTPTDEATDLVTRTNGALSAFKGDQDSQDALKFDASRAESLVTRWAEATRRTRKSSDGTSSTSDGIKDDAGNAFSVHLDFAYPDGVITKERQKLVDAYHAQSVKLGVLVTQGSTWSSISNEITRRAKAIDALAGKRYDKKGEANPYMRPDSASAEWRAFVKATREGDTTVHSMTVPTAMGDMVVKLQRV